MARKRSFSRDVITSTSFLDMPLSAQGLYFHLCMNADDDGFIDNSTSVARYCQATADDMQCLFDREFILPFPSSDVIAVKHWKRHNTIQSDRYTPTVYKFEISLLGLTKQGEYTFNEREANCLATEAGASWKKVIKDLERPGTGLRRPKRKIIKDDKGNMVRQKIERTKGGYVAKTNHLDRGIGTPVTIVVPRSFVKPTIAELKEYCEHRKNNVDVEKFYKYYESRDWFIGNKKMIDWKNAIRDWELMEKKSLPLKQTNDSEVKAND